RDQFAGRLDAGFLLALAPRHRFIALVLIDEPRDRLDLPGREPGIKRRQAKLLNEHDAVARGAVEDDRDGLAAAQHVVVARAAPLAGKQLMAEPDDLNPPEARERRPDALDSRSGMRGRRSS